MQGCHLSQKTQKPKIQLTDHLSLTEQLKWKIQEQTHRIYGFSKSKVRPPQRRQLLTRRPSLHRCIPIDSDLTFLLILFFFPLFSLLNFIFSRHNHIELLLLLIIWLFNNNLTHHLFFSFSALLIALPPPNAPR